METLAAKIAGTEFTVVRKGYLPDEVDSFLTELAAQLTEIEDALRQQTLRATNLEKKLSGLKDAEARVELAYMAAAEAKQKLLSEADTKAEEIIRKAEARAEDLTAAPQAEADEIRKQAEDILLQAKARLEEVERETREVDREAQAKLATATEESKRIVADAQSRAKAMLDATEESAESIVTDARTEAKSAAAESLDEVEAKLARTRTEHTELARDLVKLKAAVADMLENGAAGNDAIRVVLDEEDGEETPDAQAVSA